MDSGDTSGSKNYFRRRLSNSQSQKLRVYSAEMFKESRGLEAMYAQFGDDHISCRGFLGFNAEGLDRPGYNSLAGCRSDVLTLKLGCPYASRF